MAGLNAPIATYDSEAAVEKVDRLDSLFSKSLAQ